MPATTELTLISGLSRIELNILAQTVITPERQKQLANALELNHSTTLSDEERLRLDNVLNQLLDEVDHVALLKARALYTLQF